MPHIQRRHTPRKLVPLSVAIRHWGITRKVTIELIETGVLPAVTLKSGRRLVRLADIDQLRFTLPASNAAVPLHA